MELTREEFLRFLKEGAEAARKVVARDTARLAALDAQAPQQSVAGK